LNIGALACNGELEVEDSMMRRSDSKRLLDPTAA
jgi:hypothetical protein